MHMNAQAGLRPGNRMLYVGDIAFTPTPQRLITARRGVVAVENGIVSGCFESMADVPADWQNAPKTDFGDALVIPGFNDLHIHAPQYPSAGLGLDKELLPWLETYTFPAEARFASPEYAQIWYRRFIQRMWEVGTLRFSAFATLHRDATLTLARLAQESGLRPIIGKVNMDRNGSEALSETTEASLDGTVAIIETMRSETPDIGYIVTPRFVPSTTPELMRGLAGIAQRYDLPVQSHLSENRGEVAWVRELHPECASYTDVYEQYGLLRDGKTIMAHCIYLNDEEIDTLRRHGVTVAHCPQSNANLTSGIMPARRYLGQGLHVAIASDVDAGHVPDMNRHIAAAIAVSKLRQTQHADEMALRLPEAFHMATKEPGEFLGVATGQAPAGSFEPGYAFDALVVEPMVSPWELSVAERVEQFIYTGTPANISHRYVAGREIPCPFAEEGFAAGRRVSASR